MADGLPGAVLPAIDGADKNRRRDTESRTRHKYIPLAMVAIEELCIGPQSEHKEAHNKELADFNANVEQEQRHKNAFTKHHDLEIASKCQTVNEAEDQSNRILKLRSRKLGVLAALNDVIYSCNHDGEWD